MATPLAKTKLLGPGDSEPTALAGFEGKGAKVLNSGKTLVIEYAQVEKGILRKLANFEQYPTVKSAFAARYPDNPATSVFCLYRRNWLIYTGQEDYWPNDGQGRRSGSSALIFGRSF